MTKRVAKKPFDPVGKWRSKFIASFEVRHTKTPSNDVLTKLCAIVVRGGELGMREKEVYGALCSLFVNQKRIGRWGKALAKICNDVDNIDRIVASIKAYRDLAKPGYEETIREANFKLDQVVSVMLQIPRPEAYVRACVREGIMHPGSIFHPSTLKKMKRRLKGVFRSYDSEGRHSEQVRDKFGIDE